MKRRTPITRLGGAAAGMLRLPHANRDLKRAAVLQCARMLPAANKAHFGN